MEIEIKANRVRNFHLAVVLMSPKWTTVSRFFPVVISLYLSLEKGSIYTSTRVGTLSGFISVASAATSWYGEGL